MALLLLSTAVWQLLRWPLDADDGRSVSCSYDHDLTLLAERIALTVNGPFRNEDEVARYRVECMPSTRT